ncbi:hypothetical protein RDWZM_008918 [Blomia tropicalis]|uniref:Phosphofurin acidic cluster sorting protein 2 n=1 Tax=Blomia tropicalis TaxID=40697 RepID=A0A9Q0RKJ8_BLOTA|nr:hypothetical protein RDWZM_008918 [Blomia tropicalis]
MWSNKPVKMKLFGAWEIDKTPPDCIPRLCSLNINRIMLTRPLRQDVTAIMIVVKMQSSKRILRSNEITIPVVNDSSNPSSMIDIEIDLSFTLQYPHFLKRNCNDLQIILQRRKKYKNKAILGFKTLACGVIDMAEVLQRSTIVEKNLDLLENGKESSKTDPLARITISTLRSQPIDQDGNARRGKVSIDRPDVYSDEDDFTSAEDGSDSETIEENNSRDRISSNHFRHKMSNRNKTSRKLFLNNGGKFQSNVKQANVQQRNFKQKIFAMLKKLRLPDSDAYDSEEKLKEALEKELGKERPEPQDIDEFFDDEEIEDLDDLSDSGQEFDDVSITSTPKPSLRPFFSSCTLVGHDKCDEFSPFVNNHKNSKDNDSQENSGTEQTPDTSDTSQKYLNMDTPTQNINVENNTNSNKVSNKNKPNFDKENKRVKLFARDIKDKENKSISKEKKPIGATLSLSSKSFVSKPIDDANSPKESITEQLNRIFLVDEPNSTIPDEIVFLNMSESLHSQLLFQCFERSHHIIGTQTIGDVKFAFQFMCAKIQKFCNTNLKIPLPIRVALIGSDAYVNSFLRVYVELLSSKSPDWQTYLRFYIVPSNYCSFSSLSASSSAATTACSATASNSNNISSNSVNQNSMLLHKHLANIDPLYSNFFFTPSNTSSLAIGNQDSSRLDKENVASISDTAQFVHEFYNKVVNYLRTAQAVVQIPIAEAMVTYRDKNAEDTESNRVFIPFICDAKIGIVDSNFGNHSMENDDIYSASPPGASTSLGNANTTGDQKPSVTSPLSISGKDSHSTSISLTPPNSPSISHQNHHFLQTSSNISIKEKDSHKDKDKDSLSHESMDLQIDYWTSQSKFNDASISANAKKNENSKFTLKTCFRNLQISRLPNPGESSANNSLTLYYMIKEKKQKIMRLGKKKEKENESKCQVIDGICRLICSCKATQSPIKVSIDGVELSGVKFFQLTTQWQTQIKYFPLVIFSPL